MLIDKLIVSLEIISFSKNIKKPIKSATNRTLKKFSFLWNLLVKPSITKDNTTIKIGLSISDK